MAAALVIQRIGAYDVELGFDLGCGAFGTVFEGYSHGNEQERVAVKRITVLNETEFTNEVEKEFRILKSMPAHRNIVKVICMEKTIIPRDFYHIYMWMFMELCELGSMRSFCRNHALSIPQKVAIMCQCADAVLFLHNQNIVHRDIKPQKMLLTGDRTKPTVRLAGFHCARAIEKIRGKDMTMHTFVGTLPYMAPEFFSVVMDGTEPAYGKTVDTFSLGLTFLAITEAKPGNAFHAFKVDGKELGKHLWTTKQNMESIMNPVDPPFQRELKEVFSKMLRFGPNDRISMELVLQQLQEIQTFFSQPILVTAGGELETVMNNYISVIKNNQWLNITIRPDACQTMGIMICAVRDGLLFIGGDMQDLHGAQVPVAQCHYYSLFNECWTQMADMSTRRGFSGVIEMENDVYVMGGLMENNLPGVTCEKLNVMENRWSSLNDMTVPMAQPYIAEANGYLFVAPSWLSEQHNCSNSKLCMLCYDPVLDSFTEKSEMPDNGGGSFVSANKMLYLFGAADNKFHQYNPNSDQWTEITRPSIQITGMESNAAVRGGKIVLFHGTEAEEYDTTNDSWSHCTIRLPQMMTSAYRAQYNCFTTYLNNDVQYLQY